MKDKVRIKSFSKGLILQMDDQLSFEELLVEIATKFEEARSFFGRETVALSFSGRKLSEEEELQVMDTIQAHCDLKILCIVDKDEEREKTFVRAMSLVEFRKMIELDLEHEIQVFHGSLKDGEELETPNSIVIFGDVESGCSITSEKNILILGTLYGNAHAGSTGDKKAIVVALEMAPQALAIGDFKYEPTKKSKWGKKKKEEALVAKVLGDSVITEELTKEHLKDF